MVILDTAVAIQQDSKTPYQLDIQQTTQACKVLLRHITDEKKQRATEATKPDLLASQDDASDQGAGDDDVPIWLVLTTKKHVVDKKRLKPSKILSPIPYSLHTAISETICLITADPQQTYKDAIAHLSFPTALRSRITRIIGFDNLRRNYHQYEKLRQLFAEHDVFLADDRIITYLPHVLGKTFYHGGTKRPVPVDIAANPKRGEDGKKVKKAPEEKRNKEEDKRGAASPTAMATQIEKALGSALVHLAPGATTSVKVAKAGFTPEMACQNIEAVVQGLTSRFVPKAWRGVRAIHIKGPSTVAFPVWLASELWAEEEDVLEKKKVYGKKDGKAIEGAKQEARSAESTKKRKAEEIDKPEPAKHAKKKRKAEDNEKMAADVASRKETLKKQKAEAMLEVGGSAL